MRVLRSIAAVAVTVLLLFAVGAEGVSAGEANMSVALGASLAQDEDRIKPKSLDLGGLRRVAQAACGLCTDVDCCGGSENGWKLCQSDCPSGQYKCMQVAVCP